MPDAAYLAQTLVNGLSVGCIYGLIGIGFCVIYNASGIVNFAQGAFVMLGGMVTFVADDPLGLPIIVASALLAVAAVAALRAWSIERLVVRPLWHRHATMFVMILATLAVQIVIERADPDRGGRPAQEHPGLDRSSADADRRRSRRLPDHLDCGAPSLLLIWPLGPVLPQDAGRASAMRACSINREAAALQGIPVSRMLALSFALSAALGAIAGILLTPTQFTAFNVGTSLRNFRLHRGDRRWLRPAVWSISSAESAGPRTGAGGLHARIRAQERCGSIGAARVPVHQAVRHPRGREVMGE